MIGDGDLKRAPFLHSIGAVAYKQAARISADVTRGKRRPKFSKFVMIFANNSMC